MCLLCLSVPRWVEPTQRNLNSWKESGATSWTFSMRSICVPSRTLTPSILTRYNHLLSTCCLWWFVEEVDILTWNISKWCLVPALYSIRNECYSHNQLRELETSRRARERELEEANFRLSQDQEALRQESRKLQETLLNDTDHRLMAVRKMCTSLKSEVKYICLLSVVQSHTSSIFEPTCDKTNLHEILLY